MSWTYELDNQDSLNKIKLLDTTNCILVRNLYENKGSKTKAGIILPIDDQFEKAEHANRIGEVVKVPDNILYNKGNWKYIIPWQTDMELKEGDIVWYSAFSAVNANKFKCDGEDYLLISYSEVKVAKRKYGGMLYGDVSSNNRKVVDGYEIIPVNGYYLLEEVREEVRAIEYVRSVVNTGKGRVAFVARGNRKYGNKSDRDVGDGVVGVGDIVIFNNKNKHVVLESGMHKKFNKDKEYIVMQSRYFVGHEAS